MKSAKIPENETARLEELHRYLILDTPPESAFDQLAELAATICEAPVATITLIDKDREWYKSKIGISDEQASRDVSLCAHTILGTDLLIVPDTLEDDRFIDNPFVLDEPPLRFYAGAPLITPDGYTLGTLCVIDHVPRKLTEMQINALKILARQVMIQLEHHRTMFKYVESRLHLYDHIVSGTTDFMSFIDRNYAYQVINDTYLKAFNKRREEIVGHTLADLFGEEFFQAHQKQQFDLALTGQKSGYEAWFDLPAYGRRYFIVDYTPFKDGGLVIGVIVSARDITERKQADEVILRSRENLRNLAARLHAIREEERTRISREIHDELGQILTGLRIDVAWLLKKLSPRQHAMAERARKTLLLVDEALDTVRRISHDLRPAILDDLGLEAAIEWQMEEFQLRTGCQYKLKLNANDIGLNQPRDTALFRILQEALTNITRHAQATCVNVCIKTRNGELILEINDDGVGISEEKISSSQSIGMIGMRERARAIGGYVNISRPASGGTQVTMTVPLAGTHGHKETEDPAAS